MQSNEAAHLEFDEKSMETEKLLDQNFSMEEKSLWNKY